VNRKQRKARLRRFKEYAAQKKLRKALKRLQEPRPNRKVEWNWTDGQAVAVQKTG
jgi:hypothetical protein